LLSCRFSPSLSASAAVYRPIFGDNEADDPLEATELSTVKAVDQAGRDVRQVLEADDDLYLVMPKIGDFAQIAFTVPPLRAGRARTFILKAKGYYDVHLDGQGEPQTEALAKMNEPGQSIRLAMKEFLKMRDRSSENIIRKP
jgi:hypothetical protein